MIDAVLLAAGNGERAGFAIPKQFEMLGPQPVITYALDLFEDMPEIRRVIVALPEHDFARWKEMTDDYGYVKTVFVQGGKTRQESCRNALERVREKRVIIHEAVRPFVTPEHVRALLSRDVPAIVPVLPMVPTVATKYGEYPPRDELRIVQTPQIFDTEMLREAHAEEWPHANFTDDSGLFQATQLICPIFVTGLEENIKLTTPLDFRIAEAIRCARLPL